MYATGSKNIVQNVRNSFYMVQILTDSKNEAKIPTSSRTAQTTTPMASSDDNTSLLRLQTPPPQHEPTAPVVHPLSNDDNEVFKTQRRATMLRLHTLFNDKWLPMTRRPNSFSSSTVTGEVLEKLPRGKT
jgi:type IV secretory pathway VirB10-like protein